MRQMPQRQKYEPKPRKIAVMVVSGKIAILLVHKIKINQSHVKADLWECYPLFAGAGPLINAASVVSAACLVFVQNAGLV